MRETLPIFEMSSEATVSGRRPIKAVLHEIFSDSSHYQKNGISWNEEYTKNNMATVAGMSITAEFLSEERKTPYGHGLTDMKDNMPLLEDATVVGHFDRAYIDTIEINGETKTVLVGEGTLDEMRYPKFVGWVKDHLQLSSVEGSVEIVGKLKNDNHIVYDGGWKEEGRVPQEYDYSGYAILSIEPADDSAIVLELNAKQQKKEEEPMDENLKNEMVGLINNAITEQNNKWDEYYANLSAKEAEITQLTADIAAKEAEIAQLRADFEKEEAARMQAEAGLSEANSKIEAMKADAAKAELNSALEGYTDEQKAVAQEEIDKFMETPGGEVEINSIIGKICTDIVRKARETKPEPESAIDIFAIVENNAKEDDDEDVEVF